MEKLQTAVLVSGGGTNLQALIDNEKTDPNCPYHIALVISSSSKAYALERAKNAQIPAFVASATSILGAEKVKPADRDEKRFAISAKVLDYCHEYKIEAIVLAGFLTVLGGSIIEEYSYKTFFLSNIILISYF